MDGPVSQHESVRRSYDAVAEVYADSFRSELPGTDGGGMPWMSTSASSSHLRSPVLSSARGLPDHMRLERVSYPGEVETRRAYLMARRQP